jgi:4-diphosphocytidyl-2-C-methyl-D-erythritol kinase
MSATDAQLESVTVHAPAKINLALHVCGRRSDGYHLLDSLVVFTDVGDRISVSKSEELSLEVTGPFGDALVSETNNLVMRAAHLLRTFANIKDGARIRLEKNLPVASGIGGGSSDAAATLRACAELWAIDPTQISNTELAAKLGADVPVCVLRKPAFMSGIGEVLSPAPPLPTFWLVLVNSGQPLVTKTVFAALSNFSPALTRGAFDNLAGATDLAGALKSHQNDLTGPARALAPSITSALSALENAPECLLARLSGSGPTCFGVFTDEHAARNAAALISSREPGWWVVPARILND